MHLIPIIWTLSWIHDKDCEMPTNTICGNVDITECGKGYKEYADTLKRAITQQLIWRVIK